jgi:GNAT superfamily N-acetyltransferase
MATADAGAVVEIRRVMPDNWAVLRRIRLDALAEAPYAFGSTLAGSVDRPEQHWRDRITAWPHFIAWAGDEPVGLAAAIAEPAGEHGGDEGDGADGADGEHGEHGEHGGDGEDGGDGGDGEQTGAGASGNWQLISMWVSPQARGHGVAGLLVAAVSDWARADGADRLTLWVADASARARAFYRRTGFRRTGRRQLVRPEEPDHWEEEQVLDLSGPTAP